MNRDDVAAAGTAEGVESRPLTGLRGAAALLVMLHHFYLKLALDQHLPLLQFLLRKGYLGVDLFFVLSGFVMAMVYGAWFDGTRARRAADYVRFIIRRVARLWPLHAAVLMVLLGFDIDPPHLVVSLRMAATNLLMVQAWGFSTEINPPAWSVSTELLAYLVFPALAALALRGRVGPWLCLALVVAALAACMWLAPPVGAMRRGRLDIYYNYSVLPALRCLAGFMMGMLAWRAGQIGVVRRIAAHPWTGPAALLLFLCMMLGRVNDLIIFAVLPIAVLGMHHGRGPVHRAFAMNPIHGLGVLSYAIYLIHATMLEQFPFGYAPLRYMLVLYFVVTVLTAYAAHRLIEAPGRRLIRGAGEAALARLLLRPGLRPALKPPLQDDRR